MWFRPQISGFPLLARPRRLIQSHYGLRHFALCLELADFRAHAPGALQFSLPLFSGGRYDWPQCRATMSIENRLFPDPGDSFRRRQFRALKVAVIVGVICAVVMALVLYLLYSKQKP